jgi:hypothetical protein
VKQELLIPFLEVKIFLMASNTDLEKVGDQNSTGAQVKTYTYLPPRIHDEKYQAKVPLFVPPTTGISQQSNFIVISEFLTRNFL